MQDKYFYTSEAKQNVLQGIALVDAEGNAVDGVTTGCDGNYFQNAQFILLWVGKIPKTIDEDGNVTEWEASGAEHFNVRPLTAYPDFEALAITEIAPVTPYSIFS